MRYPSILCLIIYFTIANCAHAQEEEQISTEQFLQLSVNGSISVASLSQLDGDWETLKEALGEPLEEDCKEYSAILGFETTCDFLYDGLEILYANVGRGPELAEIVITNSTPFLEYEGTKLRVGDPVSRLEPHFPEAYVNRGPLENAEGHTSYFVRLNIAGSVSNLYFEYDVETQNITEIVFYKILT